MRILKRARVVAAALGVVAGTLMASAGPGASVSQAATPADGATAAASRIYGVEIVEQGGGVGDLQTQSVRCPQRHGQHGPDELPLGIRQFMTTYHDTMIHQ
ncbi:hypothetical protein [Streptomyces sp. NPDC001744]|uniref:hypothetical protein n=1 Tax=Streptomyces sp. NPDC001744 TaxID=3364606 RepID=UPI0036977F87